ncbi:hypothetical protein [Cellulomonas sp. NS3]|uniref:hypothetical protein n=1 Tax=Cellulomonas sp. NS3 TaxID=2973977 RepID=UPI002163F6FD|nr:hypothetical protein [Cellulomonas sp. NS3]
MLKSRRVVVGWMGASVLMLAGVAVALGSGGAAVAADGAEGEVQSSLVEDFAYPGAADILASDGLEVISGDGHIEFDSSIILSVRENVQCADDHIQVSADVKDAPTGSRYCFRTSGERGFLKLRVPYTYSLRGGSETVTATAELPGPDVTVTAEPGEFKSVAPNRDPEKMPEAILVELRFGAW